jgi:hypothetical protein
MCCVSDTQCHTAVVCAPSCRLTSGAATPPLTTSQQALPPSKDLQSHTSGSNALVSKLSGDASSGTASTVAPLGQFQHANRSHSKSGDGAHVVVPVGPPSHNQHQHSQQQQSASMGGSPGISGSTAGVPARDGTASVTSALPPNVMGPAGVCECLIAFCSSCMDKQTMTETMRLMGYF